MYDVLFDRVVCISGRVRHTSGRVQCTFARVRTPRRRADYLSGFDNPLYGFEKAAGAQYGRQSPEYASVKGIAL
jgi:hypothetical protein